MNSPASVEEAVSSMTPAERDRWWLDHVYQADAPQLTIRVIVFGFLIGGVLATTNLYVGAKIGATLGTSITAVVLAVVFFDFLHRIGLGRRFGSQEGAVVQSIASSAGYMASPLTASMAAYMVVMDRVVPSWQMILWLLGISLLGVLFAIPLKRRFINNEQLPFPEGRACGVMLMTLRDDEGRRVSPGAAGKDGVPGSSALPARMLGCAGLVAGMIRLLQSETLMHKIRLGFCTIPETLDTWYYRLAGKQGLWVPSIAGTPLRELTVRPTLDIAVLALGGLIGMRTCLSLIIGAVVNYCVLAPWMIQRGDIATNTAVDGSITVGFRAITTWSLWCGAAIMTSAALWSFFVDRRLFANMMRPSAGSGTQGPGDPLGKVEIPTWIFFAGLPIAGSAVVWMAHSFFDVAVWLAMISIPLVFFLTIIAVKATALTSMTPHGALGKVTQLACGALAPNNITSNIVAASVSAEVALQASNFIQNIKPGYMVGAKPRLQAIGHLIGAISGAVAGVGVFYAVFMKDGPSSLIRAEYPFPAVVVWRAVAEALTGGLSGLPGSAVVAGCIGVVAGILAELLRTRSNGKFPISPIGFGLAFVIPFDISLAMFVGASVFWLCGRRHSGAGAKLSRSIVQNLEPICAGAVAGAAFVSVVLIALETFFLGTR
ncbi:hypothetical protein B7486_12510 [cyanobacterium TDX16]|nr:hypothetical protein B7486_12510 [cyanobacterium TDX16]